MSTSQTLPAAHSVSSLQDEKQPAGDWQAKFPRQTVAAQAPAPLHTGWMQASIMDCVPQLPVGSSLFNGSAWHAPSKPDTAQLWQLPQLVVPAVQQTPSTQLPVAHWLAAVQAVPATALPTHFPAPLQNRPAAQLASVLQVVRHMFVDVLHTNPSQETAGLAQVPAEQLPAPVTEVDVAEAHTAVEQLVPSAYFWQAPAPSHLPLVPQLAAP